MNSEAWVIAGTYFSDKLLNEGHTYTSDGLYYPPEGSEIHGESWTILQYKFESMKTASFVIRHMFRGGFWAPGGERP